MYDGTSMATGGLLDLLTDGDVVEISPPKNFGSSKSRSMKQKKVLQHEVIHIDVDEDSSDKRIGASNRGKTISDFCEVSNNGKRKATFPSSFTSTIVENTGLRNLFQSSSSSGPVKHGSNIDGDIFDLISDDEDGYTDDLSNIDYNAVDTNIPCLLGPSQSQQMQVDFPGPPQSQQMQANLTSSSHSSFQSPFFVANQTSGMPLGLSMFPSMSMNPYFAGGTSTNMHMNSNNHYSAPFGDVLTSNLMQSVGAKTPWGLDSWHSKKQYGINSPYDSGVYMESGGANTFFGSQAPMPFWQEPPQFDYSQSGNTYIPPCDEESVSLSPHPPASASKPMDNLNEALKELDLIKQFDTVDDWSDHHYARYQNFLTQPQRSWTKAIQNEWRILQKDLPETVFVRVYESRMDLLRAVMVGAQGTPYHDGLFFFDVSFPPGYPFVPPDVWYHSGGLRLNPNLYENGKVCLSLLNTWPGMSNNEQWIPGTSTMLQVLVSIQALILNEKPFFNEPGYEAWMGMANGEKKSLEYNEKTWKKSLKTMLYTMKKPAKHFEELIVNHFRNHAHAILEACKAYMNGAQVGSFVRGEPQLHSKKPAPGKKRSTSKTFKKDVAELVNLLVKEFTRVGVQDCDKFVVPDVSEPQTKGKRSAAHQTYPANPTMATKIMKLASTNNAKAGFSSS